MNEHVELPGQAAWAEQQEREHHLAQLCGTRNVLDAQMCDVVRAQIAEGVDESYRTPASWLAHRLGCTPARARALVRIAERADELPVSYATFHEGRLSVDQMAAIARRVPSAHDAEACELAVHATPAQLAHLFARYPWDEPVVEAETAEPVSSTFVGWDDDGRFRLTSRLDAPEGAVVDAALRAHHDELWSTWLDDKRAADEDGQPFTTPQPGWDDALVRMAEHTLAGPSTAGRSTGGTSGGVSRPHVLVHLDAETRLARIHLGPVLRDADRRRMTCDTTARWLVTEDGRPLGIGRRSQAIPDRTRRWVEQRDGGCRVPGCTSRRVQCHHLHHWEDGGPTETANLVALCPAHHRSHHRGHLDIDGHDADDRNSLVFRNRWGRRLDGVGRPSPGRPPPRTAPYRCPAGEPGDWSLVDFHVPISLVSR